MLAKHALSQLSYGPISGKNATTPFLTLKAFGLSRRPVGLACAPLRNKKSLAEQTNSNVTFLSGLPGRHQKSASP